MVTTVTVVTLAAFCRTLDRQSPKGFKEEPIRELAAKCHHRDMVMPTIALVKMSEECTEKGFPEMNLCAKIMYGIGFKRKRHICINKNWQWNAGWNVPLLPINLGDMASNARTDKNIVLVHDCEPIGALNWR